ncbi:MAG: right-handed parallel beta-helix repeat-containing protein [Opitutaceae bacterium]|nr:right-handed parallel beta-helix repeat-containing protein [Opitutaceae bacterium]
MGSAPIPTRFPRPRIEFAALVLALAPALMATPGHSPADYGAALDGRTLDRAALQAAIDAAHAAGGGTVAVPAGRTLLTGSFEMKSRVTLHLAPGSRLVASTEREDYRDAVLIEAFGAEEIAFTGSGTIDGCGPAFMAEEQPHIFRPKPWRPKVMLLEGCRRVRLSDFTIRDSPNWTIHFAGCDDVTVRGVTILNNRKIPNCDGIAPDHSRNVRISDCHIEAGDDCIVIKNRPEYMRYGPSENIIVTNCTLVSTSAALKLGTETHDDIRGVLFSNCVIRGSHRGIALVLRDEGSISDVLVHNLVIETKLFHPAWWGGTEPIYVSARPRTPGGKIGTLRGLRFSHIIARGPGGVFIAGSPECVPDDIVLDHVTVELTPSPDFPHSRIDERPPEPNPHAGPPAGEFRAEQESAVATAPLAGFRIREARGVALTNCTVRLATAPPPGAIALDTARAEIVRNDAFREARGPVFPNHPTLPTP